MTNLLPKTCRFALVMCALCLSLLARGKAYAGDDFAPAPPSSPNQTHCNALGDGFFAVTGSSACIKISGYVSAGTDFVAARAKGAQNTGPFAAKSGVGIETQSAVSAQAQFDTPLGPGRLYVQVGHSSSSGP